MTKLQELLDNVGWAPQRESEDDFAWKKATFDWMQEVTRVLDNMLARETVKVEVIWDDDPEIAFEDMPSIVQEVPREVYDAGYKEDSAVADWLSDRTGFLVRDWRLA